LPTNSELIVALAIAVSGGISAYVDIRTRRVPNSLTLGIAIAGVVLAATRLSGLTISASLLGFAVGLVFMLPGYAIGATGGGDVKLFAALGTMLGPRAIGFAFLYAVIAGGALAVGVALQRRRFYETLDRTAALVMTRGGNVAEVEHVSQNNRFAYAPAIALGALVAALGWVK
jgi:prepilin peptidase CpaA